MNLCLPPLTREPLDILESALHDAQEEIETLKAELHHIKKQRTSTALISLRSSVPCQPEESVAWILEENTAPELYTLSRGADSILITEGGLYQVNVRISTTCSADEAVVAVIIDDDFVSRSFLPYEENGYKSTTLIHDILRIPADSVVAVQVRGSDNETDVSQGSNQLSIVKLN